MIVYRMETKYGGGIYRCEETADENDYVSAFRRAMNYVEDIYNIEIPFHPTPELDHVFCNNYAGKLGHPLTGYFDIDVEGKNIKDFIFGFKDFVQYQKWVHCNEMVDILSNLEVSLVTYEVDSEHVILGTDQLAFDPEYAIEIDRKNISNYRI